MATVFDGTGKKIGEDFELIANNLKGLLLATETAKAIKYTGPEREKNRDIFSKLIDDLEKVMGEGIKEGQENQGKYINQMAEEIGKIADKISRGKPNDFDYVKKTHKFLRKEEKKLASFQLMRAFHKEQSNQLEKQTNVLQQILKCCEGGSSIGSQTSTISPSTRTSTSTSTSTSTDDAFAHSNIDGFFSKINKKDFKFENLFDGQEKSINQVLFGNQSMLKGMMAQAQSVSKSLLAIKDNQSLIQVFTEGTVESLIQYEQGMREALYLTAGAAKESHDLFATMAQIGNTVEITGFKQEETQKAMVKFAKIGVKYDGDAEKYKKKLSGLATTTLNTEKQLGLEAGSLQETFGDLYRFGVLNENSIANLGRGMREVSRTTGVSGEAFKKVLGTTQGIVDAMRKASTLTAASARNVTELGANAEKFGVSEEFNNINKALSSTTNLFNDASDGTRLLLFSAAASVGKLRELQQGTLTRSKEGIKSLTEGVNNVFKRFGIESADAIDQLSDSAKMQLNLVLKSSFDLELGQVKGVLKTLEASGKTFADKLLDLDKQLGKNISTEKRSAILEEQRKIKIDKNLDLLGILSEAAETSKTMNDAFSKFGTRRKEFESDLQALGLGGSNKDVIREAVSQSLTGVNAALSKAGLDKISISTAEMAKALEDPQSYQDLLSSLKNGEMKAAANSKGTLTGIDAVRFGIDKLNADIQSKIAGPLNSFLNQGMLTHIFTNAGLMLMPGIIAAIPSIVTAVIGMKILKNMAKTGATTVASTATSLAPAAAAPVAGAATGLAKTRSYRLGAAAAAPVLPMGQRFGNSMAGAGTGAMKFAGGWLKFAISAALMGFIIYKGFEYLKNLPTMSESETEDILNKIKLLSIGIGAASLAMGQIYLATLAANSLGNINRGVFFKGLGYLAVGAIIIAAAAYAIPPFILGLSKLVSLTTENIDLERLAKTSQDLGAVMLSGALIMGSLIASLLVIGGTGYIAAVLMNPATITPTLLALPVGATILAIAATVLPPFIAGVAELGNISMKAFKLNPAQIQKSLDSLMAIMGPFSKLLGFIALIGASLAGIAVGGLVGGAIGASAYLLGEAVSMISGGYIKNYGDVNVILSETLRHYFSLINSTNSAIIAYMGSLTPAQVISSLNKLQSFNEANIKAGIVLKDFAVSFGSAIPAFTAIANLSGKLSGIAVNTPEEIANKFRGIINIMQGINIIGVELEKNQAANSTSQTTALKDMMYNLTNNAIPLFTALEKIQQVTASKEYQSLKSSGETLAKASKVLEGITPHLAGLLRSIHEISTNIYAELKDLNLQNIKEGSDAATSIFGLFNQFINSSKMAAKDLSVKKLKDFSDTFGNPEMVNSLKTVMKSTISIEKIFSEGGISTLDLASISSKTKYYAEFYSSISDIMSSYSKMSDSFNKKQKISRATDGEWLPESWEKWIGGAAREERIKKEKLKEGDAETFEETLRNSFAVIKAMTKVTKDKSILPSVGDIADTREALLGLMPGMEIIAQFSSLFDVNIVESTKNLLTKLNDIPDFDNTGQQRFGKLSLGLTGMIAALHNMVTASKTFVEAGSKDFVKMADFFSELKEPLIKMNDAFDQLSKLASVQRTPDFWKNFIDSFPNTDSAELSKRMGFLKSYIVELNKLIEPSFTDAIKAMAKIQGLSIDSKTSSAIELLSNLNNFMNALKTEVGKSTVPTAGDKTLASFDISKMTKFLTENAIPILNSVKEVAEKLNNLPLNKTQLEQASAKMNLLGQLGTGLTDFSASFYKSASFFTEPVRKTRNEEGVPTVYGNWKDTSKERKEFIENYRNKLKDEGEKATKDYQDLKDMLTPGNKKYITPVASFRKFTGNEEKIAGMKLGLNEASKRWYKIEELMKLPDDKIPDAPKNSTFIEKMETNGDKIKAMFENPKLEEAFSVVGKLPKFFKTNILDPFIAGGGAQLRASNIQFISGALTGIKDIITVLTGDKGLMDVINVQLKTLGSKTSVDGGDRLKKATEVLNELGKDNAFSSFLNSLLVNIILPMRFAARISGGSRNLTEAVSSFVQMTALIKVLPEFFKLINTELPKINIKGASNLNLATSNINSIKDTLPKFLETLSYGIILPAVTKLPPIAFIAQASKRLKLATTLGEDLAPFINKFAAMNQIIGGNLEKINLVDCIGTLIQKLDPADTALSMLADKLIKVKESLQSIADSMTNIVSISGKSDVIGVLSQLQLLTNNITDKAKNTVKLNPFDNITSQVQLNNVPSKTPKSDDDTEAIAKNTEKMKDQQANEISLLKQIVAALLTQPKSSSNNANISVSNSGAINLNPSTGDGQGPGNAFKTVAYSGSNYGPRANT